MRQRLTIAKPLASSVTQAVPAKTTKAAARSPRRTKKLSTACLALYFSSRVVGSHSSCLAVFITE